MLRDRKRFENRQLMSDVMFSGLCLVCASRRPAVLFLLRLEKRGGGGQQGVQ